jgi:hypothetical protein
MVAGVRVPPTGPQTCDVESPSAIVGAEVLYAGICRTFAHCALRASSFPSLFPGGSLCEAVMPCVMAAKRSLRAAGRVFADAAASAGHVASLPTRVYDYTKGRLRSARTGEFRCLRLSRASRQTDRQTDMWHRGHRR